MKYQLIKSLWINKEQITITNDSNDVTIEKDDFSFSGQSIQDNDMLSTCIKGEDSTYAVLLRVDPWVKKDSYNIVVFQCPDSNLEDFMFDMKYTNYQPELRVSMLNDFYLELKKLFKDSFTAKSSSPAAPNSERFRSIISGNIEVKEKYTHYGEYNSRSYIVTGLQIGSGIEKDVNILIQAIAKSATIFVSSRIKNATPKISSGTSFNTIGLEIY